MDVKRVLAAMDLLVLERLPDGLFVRRGALPTWCLQQASAEIESEVPFDVVQLFPFLGTFLEAAGEVWDGTVLGPAYSGFWSQSPAVHLRAHAIMTGDMPALLIARDERLFQEQQQILQRARELRLTHDALLGEIEQKDVLLHTIVDELTTPLHSLLGLLSQLQESGLRQPVMPLVRGALDAAQHQKQLIGEVLELFSAERRAPQVAEADAPEVHQVMRQVVAGLAPSIARGRIRMETGTDAEDAAYVACERRRLARVISNLAGKALSRSPPGGRVELTARKEGKLVTISAVDEGPIIPVERMARLFDKVSPDGGANLGLYFCRITAEGAGGGVGYEPVVPTGARFWVRLQSVGTPAR